MTPRGHNTVGKAWGSGLPGHDLNSRDNHNGDFAFNVRVKALHHWIRKGHPEKAANAARIAGHHARCILSHGQSRRTA